MKLIFTFLSLFLFGCCTCPSQDLYFFGESIKGKHIIIGVEKGYFDNRENWLSQEEMERQFQIYLDEMNLDEQTTVMFKFLYKNKAIINGPDGDQ